MGGLSSRECALRVVFNLANLYEGQRDVLRAGATPQPFGTYTQRLAGPAELGSGVTLS